MQILDDSLSSSFRHPNCFTSSLDTTEEVKDIEGVGMTLVVDDNWDNRGSTCVVHNRNQSLPRTEKNTGYGRGPATMIKVYLQLQGPSIDH
jgi:hypothetical protein